MKELFSIEPNGLFWIEEENEVYSVFNFKSNSRSYFDKEGKPISYQRKHIEDTDISNDDFEPQDEEEFIYNQYGIACGDSSLIDREGNEIPDTTLDLEGDCFDYSRYFTFALISQEQSDLISKCGTAPGIMLDIYDTKTRKYVAKGVSEDALNVSAFEGEPEVILAAIDMLDKFDCVDVREKGTILGRTGKKITVFNYYAD